MSDLTDPDSDEDHTESPAPFEVTCLGTSPKVLIVCEHASCHIPSEFSRLGISEKTAQSHVAWDPGALPVAQIMALEMQAVLVNGTVSRLVYDCNRPPEAPSAIPERSEVFDIPGNRNLTRKDRERRIAQFYEPFKAALSGEIARHRNTLKLMVTIHSFTPVFNKVPREVELGILHGRDSRFADAMMKAAPKDGRYCIRLNEPYAAVDGVAHTLDQHGTQNGLPNVMIEIRNDLIATQTGQNTIARYISDWVQTTLEGLPTKESAA